MAPLGGGPHVEAAPALPAAEAQVGGRPGRSLGVMPSTGPTRSPVRRPGSPVPQPTFGVIVLVLAAALAIAALLLSTR